MAVMQNPENTAGRLIAAAEVQGTSVYNHAGKNSAASKTS